MTDQMKVTVTTTSDTGCWSVSTFSTREEANAYVERLDRLYAEAGLTGSTHRVDEVPLSAVTALHAAVLGSLIG